MKPNNLRDSIVIVAGIVIILGAARYAQTLVVQFLLAVFLAIVAAAPVGWLKRKGLPPWAAMASVLAMLVLMLTFLSTLLGHTVDDFAAALPEYEARVSELVSGLIAWLDARGIDVSRSGLRDALDPAAAMGFIDRLMGSLGQVLSNVLLIMITVMFILFEASQFPAKVDAMRSEGGPFTSEAMGEILDDTKRYIGLKAVISMVTGLLVWIGVTLVGLDFAVLWGFVAFMFNFVPTIGSIIAAVPAVVLALIQLGPAPALVLTGIYMAINIVIGNFVEPTVMMEPTCASVYCTASTPPIPITPRTAS